MEAYMKKAQTVALIAMLLLFGAKSSSLHAQEKSPVWLGVPISVSYEFPMQEVPDVSLDEAQRILSRLDLDLGLQLFFRLGSSASLGLESGISAPVGYYALLATQQDLSEVFGVPFHVPARLVLNLGGEGFNVDIFGGVNFNIAPNDLTTVTTLTADIGVRTYFSHFFLMLGYNFPVEETIEGIFTSAVQNYWQNSLRIGAGFRIGGP